MATLGENREEEHDPQFAPVHQLTDKDQIQTKTLEEDEDVQFKMRAKLFRFDSEASEWKERGTGDVRILAHRETKKVRLVMRRDKTLKVCANHYITGDMKLQPNIGSDRSWVWKVAADVSDGAPTAETLAIRFANSDNAGLFKTAFEEAQQQNAKVAAGAPAPASVAEPTSAVEGATTGSTPAPALAVTESTPAPSSEVEPTSETPAAEPEKQAEAPQPEETGTTTTEKPSTETTSPEAGEKAS